MNDDSQKIKILFVCHGNICRSPAAEGTLRHYVAEKNLTEKFHIDSAGTAAYHIGELPNATTREIAKRRGIKLKHLARQFTIGDFDEFDYILTMDRFNHEEILRMIRNENDRKKVMKFRTFDPRHQSKNTPPPDVPDPYYGGEDGFEQVQNIMERTTANFLSWLIEKHH